MTLAERLLLDFDLSELLEMNDLTDVEVLELLIDGGYIGQPEGVVAEFEEFEE